MLLDLKQIFNVEGNSMELTHSIDLSEMQWNGTNPFTAPVAIKGCVQNKSRIVTLSYTASFEMDYLCDRCLSEQHKTWELPFEHIVVSELFGDDEDDYILAEGYQLDLTRLVTDDVMLALPSKLLCREDCKGLCPHCGADLNQSECSCKPVKEIDPRLAVLKQLLD